MICQGCLENKEFAVSEEFKGATVGFCKKCLKELFNNKKVSPVLPFNSPYTESSTLFTDLTTRMSISGVQIKYSLVLQGKTLVLTDTGGQYILKPIPTGQLKNLNQAPANEHLTMQIAQRCFNIGVPPNALVYFQDGTPAYLVKRFDIKPDGSKIQQEDFAQVAQISSETHGENYKYDLSYEELGALIRRYIAMYPIEIEKFFRLVLFHYIFSNGDAHAKNFSVLKHEPGDYILTPAYDLLCTRIHAPHESDLALTLFKDDFSDAYNAHGFYTQHDFMLFGATLGIKGHRVVNIIAEFKTLPDAIPGMIDASFLHDDIKATYKKVLTAKRSTLDIEWK
jgi:serine/threonine-protein kinase HipA